MSEETQTVEVNTTQPANALEGVADRFTARMANQPETVREASPENENNNAIAKEDEAKVGAKSETKKEPEKKSGIPDFNKKADPAEDVDVDKKALEEELKQHPAIKGEAAKSFAKIRDQRIAAEKALETTKAQYEARIKELESKSSGAQPKEQQEAYERAVARTKELEDELGKASIERTPKHKQFLTAEKHELDAAKSYVDGEDHQQAAIETASRLTGQARLKALTESGMNAETMAVVATNLARVDAIRRERDSFVSDWRTTQSELEQQSAQRQKEISQQQSQKEQAVFDKIFGETAPKLTAYQKVDGYEDWNSGVDQRIAETKRHFSGQSSLEEISTIITKGVGYDALTRVNDNLQEKLNTLTEELSKLKAAAPNGGSTTTRTIGDEGGTAASRFDARMGR